MPEDTSTTPESKWIYMNSTLGFEVPVKMTFETPEEYDAQVGQPGAWKQDLAAHNCYGAWNTGFRNKLAEGLSQRTGVPIPEIEGDNGKKVKIECKKFLASLIAEGKITEAEANTVAQEVAAALPPLKLSPARKSSGPKLPKEVTQKASQVIAQSAINGDTDGAAWIAGFESRYPGVWSGEFTEENVARALWHHMQVVAAQNEL